MARKVRVIQTSFSVSLSTKDSNGRSSEQQSAVRQGRIPMGCFRTRVRVASVGRSDSYRENNVFAVGHAGRQARNDHTVGLTGRGTTGKIRSGARESVAVERKIPGRKGLGVVPKNCPGGRYLEFE